MNERFLAKREGSQEEGLFKLALISRGLIKGRCGIL